MAEPTQTTEAGAEGRSDDAAPRAFFYDVDELPAYTIAEMVEPMGASEAEKQEMYDIFGRDLLTKVILQSPGLSVFHETARPGETVKPHRHGTHQITYVLQGSLHYGNRVTSAGMGYYSPDRPYSWTAGDEGAEWLEIHAGRPQAYAK
jgi:hypothetical protein